MTPIAWLPAAAVLLAMAVSAAGDAQEDNLIALHALFNATNGPHWPHKVRVRGRAARTRHNTYPPTPPFPSLFFRRDVQTAFSHHPPPPR